MRIVRWHTTQGVSHALKETSSVSTVFQCIKVSEKEIHKQRFRTTVFLETMKLILGVCGVENMQGVGEAI